MKKFNTVKEALEDLRNGRVILVTDDEDRENEGDMICAAEFATTENVNLMASVGKGLICMPMSIELCRKLQFPLLRALNTPNIVLSTISITTSFLASALTLLRSSYYALGYASNDIVLIVLWILASFKNPVYLPVAFNFMIFLINDLYGFISWKKRETKAS